MSEIPGFGQNGPGLNPYYSNLVQRLTNSTPVSSPATPTGADGAIAVASIVSNGSFGSKEQRREVLQVVESAYEQDANGVYEVVGSVNEALASRFDAFKLAIERTADTYCYGCVLNLYNSFSRTIVDRLAFKLDIASGKLLNR